MRTVSNENFGLVIAYVVPGATVLAGAGLLCRPVDRWLSWSAASGPTVSGFLYATLASIGLGVFVNTLRLLTVDAFHHRTGIRKRRWEYGQLQRNMAAIEFVVLNQFRFYQFHGNLVIALGLLLCEMIVAGQATTGVVLLVVAAQTILFVASRQLLRNYYLRLGDVLGADVRDGAARGNTHSESE